MLVIRDLSRRPERLALVVALASAGLLAGAFAFEHIGGLAPCVLCLYQRWPHALAIVFGIAAFAVWPRNSGAAALALGLAALGLFVGAAIAAYHVGVEQRWWTGPMACGATGPSLSSAMTAEALRKALLAAPVVRCDEIAWSLFGLSMAAYNFIASLALGALAGLGAWIGFGPRTETHTA
jgi:disulfide bond formation protein DsbB